MIPFNPQEKFKEGKPKRGVKRVKMFACYSPTSRQIFCAYPYKFTARQDKKENGVSNEKIIEVTVSYTLPK